MFAIYQYGLKVGNEMKKMIKTTFIATPREAVLLK